MSNKYHNKFYEGEFYHLYNRGINNEIIFITIPSIIIMLIIMIDGSSVLITPF